MIIKKSITLFSILIFTFPLFFKSRAELSSQYSITGYDPRDLDSSHRIFQQWKEKYKKKYYSSNEMMTRFQNFKNNVKYVVERELLLNPTRHTVGLTRFADLSNQEFREMYMGKLKKRVRVGGTREGVVKECHAPRSLDWRKKGVVTAVKDQGNCGSCWAFSTTGAIEGINAIARGELVRLSEQELMSCDTSQDGCDGGYMDDAFAWVISNGGIDTEADYPYTGVDSTCNITKEHNKVVSIDGYKDVAESDSALLCATVNQPISVGLVASSIDFQLYTGGIFEGNCSSDPDDIDHAVLIVGYGSQDGIDYWIVKNSWGTDWGINGYIYIRRNTNLPYGVCAINAMASYPTKTASSSAASPYPSPSPPLPPLPPPPPPPPPPSPAPTDCGDLISYCQPSQACCCLYRFLNFCMIYGCCPYTDGVCCAGIDYCCPSEFPICDADEEMCLKKSGDHFGVAAKKKKLAKHKLPWRKHEQTMEMTNEPLQWRVNQFGPLR